MALKIVCSACHRFAWSKGGGRQILVGVSSSLNSISSAEDKFSPVTRVQFRTVYIMSEDPSDTDRGARHQSMNIDEVNKFQKLSADWWNETGSVEALHLLNKLRVPLIRDGILQEKGMVSTDALPLKGVKLLDVGCGGGILSEPLARLGASVTGIDLSEELLDVAELHSLHDPLVSQNVKYVCGSIEEMVTKGTEDFDAVVASEVLEHITELNAFVENCCDLVKPGGSIFITSINKTAIAYALAIVAAESLNVVPKGSHEWDKLVSLRELQSLLERNGFIVRLVHGSIYNPVCKKWSWIPSTSCNYAVHAVKSSYPSNHPSNQSEDISTAADSEPLQNETTQT
ncbi:ubiquinone biosynthesis O-methyltransferase-like [Ptychodera flava]|uniref:ubiquinone biosynthesis O-methyltransferase-like n=1 Tax=Ptychodera flava TaxID=63121 RepID=UPI003969F49D